MTRAKSTGPVLFEVEEPVKRSKAKSTSVEVTPATAPPVPDATSPDELRPAMGTLAALAARKPSRLTRWFWRLAAALLAFIVSIAAWDFVTALLERNSILGGIALGLLGLFILVLTLIAGRELLALSRLRRVDEMRKRADMALAGGDLKAAKLVVERLDALYRSRPEMADGRAAVMRGMDDVFDADAALGLAERNMVAPLDTAAMAHVEAAARQVATVTAIVPLALADLFTALTANLRMIRHVAEVYGGRSGALGSWRLTRAVLTHLVATGAVAVGDDLIGSVAGGGVLSKLSRRFGEGIINGALTARVGVAAIEVCRPLPFAVESRPNVSKIVGRALTGIIPRSGNKE